MDLDLDLAVQVQPASIVHVEIHPSSDQSSLEIN